MTIRTAAFALVLSTGAATAQTEITFQLWGSPQEGEVWTRVAEAFEAAHPGVSVKVEVADWDSYWEKLRVLISGGTPPDVFAMDAPLYPDWQSRGALLNLQPFLDADPAALDGVFPVTLEAYKTPEGYFGLPRDFQTIVLYYNKDMFDAAGVSYPTDAWTWDDFRAAAKALTLDKDGDGSVDQWGFWAEAYDQEPFWGSVIWSHGGDIVDTEAGKTLIDSPEAQAGFELIRAMWLDDKSMPTQTQLAQYGYDGFLAGVSAMGVSGHWSVPDYASAGLNFDVAPLPSGPAGRVTGVNSAGFVISADTKNPEAAWDFVRFATGEIGQSALAELGFAVPIRESVATSDIYLKQAAPINHQMFVDALAYARPKPVFRGYEDWSSAVGDALTTIWEGDATVADAVAEAVAGGDEAFANAAE
jgi:multiple sugar transport system substrate-binding protein